MNRVVNREGTPDGLKQKSKKPSIDGRPSNNEDWSTRKINQNNIDPMKNKPVAMVVNNKRVSITTTMNNQNDQHATRTLTCMIISVELKEVRNLYERPERKSRICEYFILQKRPSLFLKSAYWR
jgi:hypothetical protein